MEQESVQMKRRQTGRRRQIASPGRQPPSAIMRPDSNPPSGPRRSDGPRAKGFSETTTVINSHLSLHTDHGDLTVTKPWPPPDDPWRPRPAHMDPCWSIRPPNMALFRPSSPAPFPAVFMASRLDCFSDWGSPLEAVHHLSHWPVPVALPRLVPGRF